MAIPKIKDFLAGDDVVKSGKVGEINQYIDAYNQQGDPLLLEVVNALAQELISNSSSPDNNLVRWMFTDPITKELSKVTNNTPPANNAKMFVDFSSSKGENKKQKPIPSQKEWAKQTKPKLLGKERSAQYKLIDENLAYLDKIRHQGTPEDKLACLNALKNKIIHTYLSIPEGKPLMEERFLSLFQQVNNELANVYQSKPELQRGAASPPVVNPFSQNEQEQIDVIGERLSETKEPFKLGNYDVRYLGGNNNRNWLATDQSTGKQYVLRRENVDNDSTNYAMVQAVKDNPELSKFVANDEFYQPTDYFNKNAGCLVHGNLAVSEYCPDGDILSHRNKQPEEDVVGITHSVLDATQQVATMALTFIKNNKAYMDIKPENFLRRKDGTLVTADIKSVVDSVQGRVPHEMVNDTKDYAPLEGPVDNQVDAASYNTYQIGIMMYRHMCGGLSEEQHNQLLEKLESGRKNKQGMPLDYDFPIFKTAEGQEIKQLIESAMSDDPSKRPSLETMINTCNRLKKNVAREQTPEVAEQTSDGYEQSPLVKHQEQVVQLSQEPQVNTYLNDAKEKLQIFQEGVRVMEDLVSVIKSGNYSHKEIELAQTISEQVRDAYRFTKIVMNHQLQGKIDESVFNDMKAQLENGIDHYKKDLLKPMIAEKKNLVSTLKTKCRENHRNTEFVSIATKLIRFLDSKEKNLNLSQKELIKINKKNSKLAKLFSDSPMTLKEGSSKSKTPIKANQAIIDKANAFKNKFNKFKAVMQAEATQSVRHHKSTMP